MAFANFYLTEFFVVNTTQDQHLSQNKLSKLIKSKSEIKARTLCSQSVASKSFDIEYLR
jgi:hypothetical protein